MELPFQLLAFLLLHFCLRHTKVKGGPLSEAFLKQRRQFYEEQQRMRIGGDLQLSAKEELVNGLLMKHKSQTIKTSLWSDAHAPYPPSVPFLQSKEAIEESVEFDIIRMMPKGGNLHAHFESLASVNWVVSNLTYLPDLFSKENPLTGHTEFMFGNPWPSDGWSRVAYQRERCPDVKQFDSKIAQSLTLSPGSDTHIYRSNREQWVHFGRILRASSALLAPLQNKIYCLEQIMAEHLEDSVTYMELRISTCTKENLAGFVAGEYEIVFQNFATSIEAFRRKHPSFVGVKFIIAASRLISREDAQVCVEEVVRLMSLYPELIIGFDISHHETRGNPTLYYLDQLLYPQSVGFNMPLFLHVGEMDWTLGFNDNLIDAVLLNVTRAGHGFASLKHPKILDAIMDGRLVIEVNPVSNQVLGLIRDLRTHPGATLFAKNLPVVIGSDDPSAWKASPLSHDFYMALMALGGVTDDLRLLKQLAMNSFRYSAMTSKENDQAMITWEKMFDNFIDDVITKYDLMKI